MINFLTSDNNSGTFTVIDIALFCAFILIASSILLYAVHYSVHSQELFHDAEMVEYTQQTLDVLLRTTIDTNELFPGETWGFEPVSLLLADMLFLKNAQNNQESPGWKYLKNKVRKILLNLTLPEYGFLFECTLDGTSTIIESLSGQNDFEPVKNTSTAKRSQNIHKSGLAKTAFFKLSLWRL